jgi:ADP-heptose:LPS heptosyltransferase
LVKFLIIRFSSIGDIVLTTPVIRCLKEQVEGAEIHYLTKKQFAPVLQANPFIDKLHVLGDTLGEVTDKLKEESFDYIIDLHNNLRSRIVKSRLKRVAFSFDKLNREKWLLVNLRINRLPDIHIVDRYLETVRLFDVKNDGKGLDYFIPSKEEVALSSLPAEFSAGYIGIVLGAQHATKKLPVERLIALCSLIKKPVVLLGGPGDKEIAEIIVNESTGSIHNACGRYSINQSASLVKQANAIITHDTGLMHIAAAFKKTIFSVWGNTVPEFGMYPYKAGPNSKIFEVTGLSCRPCSKIGFDKCPKKHFKCMKEIALTEIAELANGI